jgi:cysteine desulfurase family protein (TIGR01976 family)
VTVASDREIRSHFPALERRHHGHPVAYFDGPGGTQVPRAVGEAMVDYLYHHNANTHWAYPTSEETDRMLADARAALADFLNGRPSEVVFGQNMTTLTFHLARGLGHGWGVGDEIVVTELDHHANRAPWEALAVERGVSIRVVPFDTVTGELEWEAMDRAIGPKTRLVAVGAASNALGTVTDVARACRLARERGALSFVDAVHYAPHALVDVQAIGCDFLACSPYKFYGPHMGVLWGRESLLSSVDVPRLAPAPSDAPERLETGTLSHEGMLGSAAAVEFLAGLAFGAGSRRRGLAETFEALHRRGQGLFRQLWDGLGDIPGVVRYGPPPERPRTPTIGFTVAGHDAESVARHLAGRGVFVSHGDFYAATVVERLGLQEAGLVRAGIVCYTTEEEVARLVEGVAELH